MNGKAYGFFMCNADKETVANELPDLRRITQAPSALELSLMDDFSHIKADNLLKPLIHQARDNGMCYCLEATLPGSSNRVAAKELNDMLGNIYNSPLYKEGDEFSGAIVYEENGKYVFYE
ncbi:hypothetical protein HY639_01490 [Candidatus Woesearchaeota archaeon]|nr:hypothetical protein [Candidatus Woesearchaeota archaeon]